MSTPGCTAAKTPDESSKPAENPTDVLDTDMIIGPLTSTNSNSTPPSSTGSESLENMAFQNSRDREMRTNRAGNSSFSDNDHTSTQNTSSPGPYRRPDTQSSGYTSHVPMPMPPPSARRPSVAYSDMQMSPPRSSLNHSANMTLSEVPLESIIPGPVCPSQSQLEVAYGYAIKTENGNYTRLLRADQLPPVDNIPQFQGPEGLIILPPTRQPSPRRRQTSSMVPSHVVQSLPLLTPRRSTLQADDTTQKTIDSIIASSPPGPPAPWSAGYKSTISTPVKTPGRRRGKVYCDKWVHEGVCAFTQVGCKYKHEMPMDKETQLSLGLNHGLPQWYKRQFGSPTLHKTSPDFSRTAGSWRRNESEAGQVFGPISPPGRQPRGPPPYNEGPRYDNRPQYNNYNPYSTLSSSDNGQEEGEITHDNDNFMWPGGRFG